MDADELLDNLQKFANGLESSGREVVASVRDQALDLVSDVSEFATTTYDSTVERVKEFNAYIGQMSNDIHDAFTENDLYVIMNAVVQAFSAIVRDYFGVSHGSAS